MTIPSSLHAAFVQQRIKMMLPQEEHLLEFHNFSNLSICVFLRKGKESTTAHFNSHPFLKVNGNFQDKSLKLCGQILTFQKKKTSIEIILFREMMLHCNIFLNLYIFTQNKSFSLFRFSLNEEYIDISALLFLNHGLGVRVTATNLFQRSPKTRLTWRG